MITLAFSRSTIGLTTLLFSGILLGVGTFLPDRSVLAESVLAESVLAESVLDQSGANQSESNQNPASTASFSDIQNHWAQPFIENLAARGILAGYLDNTFRPDRPVARDEFAAMVRQAFDLPTEQDIASGSAYQDVPEGYWAAPAIEEAYEMGFFSADPNRNFQPDGSVSRVEVISALTNNLDLPTERSASPLPVAPAPTDRTSQPQTASPTSPQITPQTTRRPVRQRFMYPMAMTMLMQPMMGIPRNIRPAAPVQPQSPLPNQSSSAQPSPQSTAPTNAVLNDQVTAPIAVNDYYRDAAEIPPEAIDPVITATSAQIVVNHPDRQVLNPNQPATRAETAAFIHQALVRQGRINPLPEQNPAANYVVTP
ncbi:MAG: S-layer homology domain-containing protein [Elainella sp. Prado103]|nr:S-layer homology domain-containing protein [Elainella sp. Prado103]